MARHRIAPNRTPLWRALVTFLSVVGLLVPFVASASAADTTPDPTKVWVCEYTGPDGSGTLLSDSPTSIDSGGEVKTYVNVDAGSYYVLDAVTVDNTNTVSGAYAGTAACPKPQGDSEPTPAPAKEISAALTLKKSLATDDVNPSPGQVFKYRLSYSCSSNTTPCIDARLTDELPQGIDFVDLTDLAGSRGTWSKVYETSGDTNSRVTGVQVTFSMPVAGGTGLAAGTSGDFYIWVKFASGTAGSEPWVNCATISAANANEVEACASQSVTSTIKPNYGVDLTKAYVLPATQDKPTSGLQKAHPSTTLRLTATVTGGDAEAGYQPAKSVTVTDPAPEATSGNDPFDSFDLDELDFSRLPGGIRAVVTFVDVSGTTIASPAGGAYTKTSGTDGVVTVVTSGSTDFHGISITYTCDTAATTTICVDGVIPAGTSNLTVDATLTLRDTLRSNSSTAVPVGTIDNWAQSSAEFTDALDATKTVTKESERQQATYTVTSRLPNISLAKSLDKDSLQEGSTTPVTVTLTAKNQSSVDAKELVVFDPIPGQRSGDKFVANGQASIFDEFVFDGFTEPAAVAGATVVVYVAKQDPRTTESPTWAEAELDINGVPRLPTEWSNSDVLGVKYVYTASSGASISGSAEVTNTFRVTLKTTVAAHSSRAVNCAAVDVTTTDNSSARANSNCVNFMVTAVTRSFVGNKTISPDNAVNGTEAKTTLSLSGTFNSNVAGDVATSFGLIDSAFDTATPPAATDNTFFNNFTVTNIGKLTAPSTTTWNVYYYDASTAPGSWVRLGTSAITGGQNAPAFPDDVTDVGGVHFELASGTLTDSQGLSVQVTAKMRVGLGIEADTSVGNCVYGILKSSKSDATIPLTAASNTSLCGNYTIKKLQPSGVGTGVSKSFGDGSVVQGTGQATTVTLSGKNNSNIKIDKLVLLDKNDIANSTSPDNKFWDSFAFGSWTSDRIAWPTGTSKVTVEYLKSDGTNLSAKTYTGSRPSQSTLNSDAPAIKSDVYGIRITWEGSFAASQTGFTAKFQAKLRDGAPTQDNVRNCVQQTYFGGQLAVAGVISSACRTIDVVAQSYKVDAEKSFAPDSGPIGVLPASSTVANLKVTNSGNMSLDTVTVIDSTTTGANNTTVIDPFDRFTLTGFTTPTATGATGVTVTVDVSVDKGTTWDTYATSVAAGSAISPDSGYSGTLSAVNAVRLTYTGTINPGAALATGLKLALKSSVATTDRIENCLSADGTAKDPKGDAATVSGDKACATYTPEAQAAAVSSQKGWSPAAGALADRPASTITVTGANDGNTPFDTLTLQDPVVVGTGSVVNLSPAIADTAFNYFDVTGASIKTWPVGADQATVYVATRSATNMVEWQTPGAPVAKPSSGIANLVADGKINTVPLASIVGLKVVFSNSSGGTLPKFTKSDQSDAASVAIEVKLRAELRISEADIVATDETSCPLGLPKNDGCVENTSAVSGSYRLTNGTAQAIGPNVASKIYRITPGSVKVEVNKTLAGGATDGTYEPDERVTYDLTVKNTKKTSGNRDLYGPIIVDKFNPAQLRYDDTDPIQANKFVIDVTKAPHLSADGVIATYNETAGTVTFDFTGKGYLAPGDFVKITLVLRTKPGLVAGSTVNNKVGVRWDTTVNGAGECVAGTDTDFLGGDTWCTDDQDVKILTARALSATKWIKGDPVAPTLVVGSDTTCPTFGDDPAYTRYPCVAHTHVGGTFSYKMQVEVSGNKPIDKVRTVDVLPYIGDTGLVDTSGRLTEWVPTLSKKPELVKDVPSSTVTLYYSYSQAPCGDARAALDSPTDAWCTGDPSTKWAEWTSSADVTLSDVKAIGLQLVMNNDTALQPLDAFTLYWEMQAPDTPPAGINGESVYYPNRGVGPITWNTFSRVGHPQDDAVNEWLAVAQPEKVGIDLSNPTVTVNKTSVGREGQFEFTLTQVDDEANEPVMADEGPKFSVPKSLTTERTETSDRDGVGTASWGLPDDVLEPNGFYRLAETKSPRWRAEVIGCVNNNAPAAEANGKSTGEQESEPTETQPFYWTGDDGAVYFQAPPNGDIECSFRNTYIPPPPTPKDVTPGYTVDQCVPGVDDEWTTVVTPIVRDGITYTQTTNADGDIVLTATPEAGSTLTVPEGWTSNSDGSASIVVPVNHESCVEVQGSTSTTPPASTKKPQVTTPDVKGESDEVDKNEEEKIAYTGMNTFGMGLLALMLLAGGGLLIGVTRRREPRKH